MLLERFGAAAIAVFGLTGAIAQSRVAVTRTFLVGLGSTETAQIAVVNLASTSSSGPAASLHGEHCIFQRCRYCNLNRRGVHPGDRPSRVGQSSIRKGRRFRRPHVDPRCGDVHSNGRIGGVMHASGDSEHLRQF